MERTRTTEDKAAIAIAAAASAWVVGATLFFASGDINPAGILPTVASLLSLWAAIQRDKTWMWVGTVLALFFSVAFVFSVGLVVAPAALGLMTGSILLSREISDDSRSTQPGRIR
ncbi:MAG TPA: hypothetical protein VEB69_09540 [Acidimicrobiia bacterium]|nr:hypothetical protein [Acidimicrobiia bacterium]